MFGTYVYGFRNFHLEVTQILTYIESLVEIFNFFESTYCITPYEMAFLPDRLTNLNKTLLILLTCLLNESVE